MEMRIAAARQSQTGMDAWNLLTNKIPQNPPNTMMPSSAMFSTAASLGKQFAERNDHERDKENHRLLAEKIKRVHTFSPPFAAGLPCGALRSWKERTTLRMTSAKALK